MQLSKANQINQAIRIVSSILIGVVLVKIGVNKTNISTLEWYLFLLSTFSTIWAHGFTKSLLSYYPSVTDTTRFEQSISTLFLVGGGISALLLFILITTGLLPRTNHISILLLCLVLQAPALLNDSLFIVREQPRRLLINAIVGYLITPIIFAISYIQNTTLQGLLNGLLIISTLRFLLFLFFSFKMPSLDNETLKLCKQFIIASAPLMIYFLLGQGNAMIDGALVQHYFKEDDFVLFRFGARELPLFQVFITSFVSIILPKAVNNLNESVATVKAKFSHLMNWLFPLCIILVFASPYIYTTVYSIEYRYSSAIFNTYLLILLGRILSPHIILLAKQNNHKVMQFSIVEFILNVALSILFIQPFGMLGIVLATVLAFLIERILVFRYVKKHYNFSISHFIDTPKYILFSVLLIAAYLIQMFLI